MSTTPKEHANRIREAVDALNAATLKAYDAGLRVDFDFDYRQEVGKRHDCPLLRPTIERVEDL